MRKIAPVIQYYFSEEEREYALNRTLIDFVVCNVPMLLVYVFEKKGIYCSDIQLINITEKEAMPSAIIVDNVIKMWSNARRKSR